MCDLFILVVTASSPSNVRVAALVSTNIHVNWTEVPEIDQNGIITQYEVMYEPLITFGALSTLTDNTTRLSITLTNLEEYVEYNISVRAYTSVGPGPYSAGIVQRTLEDGKKSDFQENLIYYFEISLQCLQVHQRT